ncbi:putative ankyrin repeat protein RF_0381 isoform X2 [Phymastichus coffea]|nr:putative ankyrin repeat protein RF_0381 isoform X2 [Phymastichus coffea]
MKSEVNNKHLRKLLDAVIGGRSLFARMSDSSGRTLLHIAVLNDNMGMVEWLLDRGSDVNHQDGLGNYPLLTTLLTSNLKDNKASWMIDLLCEPRYQASVLLKNRLGQGALEQAANPAFYDEITLVMPIFHRLLDECRQNPVAIARALHEVDCPVARAVQFCSAETIGRLLDLYGARLPRERDLDDKSTALHTAVRVRNAPVAVLLARRLPHYRAARDSRGRMPIYYYLEVMRRPTYSSAPREHWEPRLVAELAPPGPQLVSRDHDGRMQIGAILAHGSAREVGALLDRLADLAAADGFGRTVTHLLACNTERLSRLLRGRSFDVGALDLGDATPLHRGVLTGNPDLVELFLERHAREGVAPDGSALLAALPLRLHFHEYSADERRQRLAVLRLLLLHGVDPQTTNGLGEPALGLAADEDMLEVAWPLLAQLAVQRLQGVAIAEAVAATLRAHAHLRLLFDECVQDVSALRADLIGRSRTTKYEWLVESDACILGNCAANEEAASALEAALYCSPSTDHYYDYLIVKRIRKLLPEVVALQRSQ